MGVDVSSERGNLGCGRKGIIGLSSIELGSSVSFCLMAVLLLDSGEVVGCRCGRCMRVYLSCPCGPVFLGL